MLYTTNSANVNATCVFLLLVIQRQCLKVFCTYIPIDSTTNTLVREE